MIRLAAKIPELYNSQSLGINGQRTEFQHQYQIEGASKVAGAWTTDVM